MTQTPQEQGPHGPSPQTRRSFLVRAGMASLAGPAVIFTGSRALAGYQSPTHVTSPLDVTSITLSPHNSVNPVGAQHTVTATLHPIAIGARVGFTIMSGPNAGLSAFAHANAHGQAMFSYHGNGGVGTDVIRAWLDLDGDSMIDAHELQATATKHWISANVGNVADIVRVELEPKMATNLLHTAHTVRARVHPHRAGVLVYFLIVAGPHKMTMAETRSTDADGFATFTWTGTHTGLDVIVAWVGSTTPKQPLDDARKLWVQHAVESPESPESPFSPESRESPESFESPESPEIRHQAPVHRAPVHRARVHQSPESPESPEIRHQAPVHDAPVNRYGSTSSTTSTSMRSGGSSSGSGSSGSGSPGSGSGRSGGSGRH